ncbi:DgyrCDS8882 [Dimorphilus gyrociliatus]|uniref:DgyrCDS8882 n=1 Tax=Dimorphilus gyrociliatus TaxID=2664684 RepID=A0A7I8VX57_9ANNE|nr:DgyrCDS8882 [Dimorphilus gyrociliatus]
MAAVQEDTPQSDGFFSETDEEDDNFKRKFLEDNNKQASYAIRPTLADDQKIGFFRQDKVCQTDVSEILDLYDTMDTVEGLVEDVGEMKKDVYFAKQALRAEFGDKLTAKSIDLIDFLTFKRYR